MAFTELPDVVLARVLAFAAPRDLEAATVASKTVSQHILPRFPLWKALFCYRWAMLNFPLDDVRDHNDANDNRDDDSSNTPSVPIEIDGRLRELFPRYTLPSLLSQQHVDHVFTLPCLSITNAPIDSSIDDCSTCTESRMFQLLAHAVTPVPSYADTDATMQYRRDTWIDHTYVQALCVWMRAFERA